MLSTPRQNDAPGAVVSLPTAAALSTSADRLRQAMKTSMQLTELQHAVLQLRVLAVLLAGSMVFMQLDPALLLAWPGESLLWRIVASTRLNPHALAAAFGGMAALLLPFLALQLGQVLPARIAQPLRDRRRGVIKLTCASLAVAGLLWAFLAWRSTHLDLGIAAPLVMGRNALGCVLFALALACSLNAERLRALLEAP